MSIFCVCHDMSNISEKPFLRFNGMNGLCMFVFLKWRGLSEISHIPLRICKNLP